MAYNSLLSEGSFKGYKSGVALERQDVAPQVLHSSLVVRDESLRGMQLLQLQARRTQAMGLTMQGGQVTTTTHWVRPAPMLAQISPNSTITSALWETGGQRHFEMLHSNQGSHPFSVPPIHHAQTTEAWQVSSLLPALLSHSTDAQMLSQFQVFLRHHIQVFQATPMDCMTHVQGRAKCIQVGQVGLRCCHCAHTGQRTKGAVYFPASTMGFYQAAQNMSATHLQCGACPHMAADIQERFTELLSTKTTTMNSAGGCGYWSHCARQMGLVDTDQGIFVHDAVPSGAIFVPDRDQHLYQTGHKAMGK